MMIISKAGVFRNILYASMTRGITLVCMALTSTVVARNLTASDYGVVGFATIIIGFLLQFTDMGLLQAAIRRPVLGQREYETAFTLRIILAFGGFIAALLIAPFAHRLLHHPATGNVIRLLALNFLLSTIGFLPRIVLTREMNYRALMIPAVFGVVVQCSLAITLVLHGWSYWSVVIANVGSTLATSVAMQLTRRVPTRLRFDSNDAQDYLRFGIPLLGSGLLVFLMFNLDNFLVGTFMGSVELGYYALAFTWGSFICVLLNDTVNNVLMPSLSAMQNDLVAIRRWYLKTVDLVAFIAVIANTALLANARWFLVTFLGKGTNKWIPALTSLQILCIYGIIRVIVEPIGPCLMVRGRTKTLLRSVTLAGSVELLLLLLALMSKKIEVVAFVILIAYSFQLVVYTQFLRNELSIGIKEIGIRIWPAGAAAVAGFATTSLFPDSLGGTVATLTARGLLTSLIVALTHGVFTRFRCFHEASGLLAQNLTRIKALRYEGS